MKPDDYWNQVFHYSDYKKGAMYSASDIIGEPLQVKLKKKYPNHDDVKAREKTSSFVGSAIHMRCEAWLNAENDFGATNMQSEVRLKHNGISGTADIIYDDYIIADIKTGKESTIKTKIKNPEAWCKQLSIYSLLNHKQNRAKYGEFGYIHWYCTDSRKYGTTKIKLMTIHETVQMIREFMFDMETPIEDEEKCKSCSWLWKWCSVRSVCDFYLEDDMSNITEW